MQGSVCKFIKTETLARVFPVNLVKLLRTFFYRTYANDRNEMIQQEKPPN